MHHLLQELKQFRAAESKKFVEIFIPFSVIQFVNASEDHAQVGYFPSGIASSKLSKIFLYPFGTKRPEHPIVSANCISKVGFSAISPFRIKSSYLYIF